jgi:antitoxin HicB
MNGKQVIKLAVAPDSATQTAMLIRQSRKDRTLSDLARALGTSWPSAQRLENPHHSPNLKQLEKAAAALGKRLVLEFV